MSPFILAVSDLAHEKSASEPGSAVAHAALAWCHHFRFSSGGLNEADRAAVMDHAHAAISAGIDDASALAIAGLVIWFEEHDNVTTLDLFDRALTLSNPISMRCAAVPSRWRRWAWSKLPSTERDERSGSVHLTL